MKYKTIKAWLGLRGVTINRTRYGQWRVNYRSGDEATAYYADELNDAWLTGLHMAESGRVAMVLVDALSDNGE